MLATYDLPLGSDSTKVRHIRSHWRKKVWWPRMPYFSKVSVVALTTLTVGIGRSADIRTALDATLRNPISSHPCLVVAGGVYITK